MEPVYTIKNFLEIVFLVIAAVAFAFIIMRTAISLFSHELYYTSCNIFDRKIFEQIKYSRKYDHRNAIVLPKKDFRRMGPWLRDGAFVDVEFNHPQLGVIKARARAFYYSPALRFLEDVGLSMNLRRYFGIEVIDSNDSNGDQHDNPVRQKSYWRPAPFVTVRWFKRPRSHFETEIEYRYTFPNRHNYIREYMGVSIKIIPRPWLPFF